jgi:HK97 family phage portal protein
MPRFLPALRGKDMSTGIEYASPLGDLTPEGKQVLTTYYNTLATAAASMASTRRQRKWEVARAVEEGYQRVVWVFKAVEVIAGNASRLPFKIMEGDREVQDHPVERLLNGPTANPLETGRQFRKRLSAQVLLSPKGAFVEVTRSRRDNPTRLDLLPPGRTEIIPGDSENPISHLIVTDVQGHRRRVERENALWFREPHPTDPFMGVTPLESIGTSIELDFFARLYNATFMRNDSRPGGILAVRGPNGGGGLGEKEAEKLESRFGPGPSEAGKMSVITGDMTYIDPVGRPRDVHYPELSRNMKIEILTAFGLDESIVGDTSGRTYSNAEQAWENFWLLDPMPSHLELLSTGWGPLIGEDYEGEWDTEKVEVLQRAKARIREEARAEVAAGLRSIKSYADVAGYGEDIPDTPQMHALWIPQGSTPIPGRTEDSKALGFAPDGGAQVDPTGAPTGPAANVAARDPNAVPAPAVDGAPNLPALPSAPGARSASNIADQATRSRSGADLVSAAAEGKDLDDEFTITEEEIRQLLEVKALDAPPRPRLRAVPVEPPPPAEQPVGHEAEDAQVEAAEVAIAAALAALAERYGERTAARLNSPKIRRGTPHFQPEYPTDTRVGTNALDTARVVDEETWASDAETVSHPYVEAAAVAAAVALLASMGEDEPDRSVLLGMVAPAVSSTVSLIAGSARRQARHLVDALSQREQGGATIAELAAAARAWPEHVGSTWARALAVQGAVSVTQASEAAAAQHMVDAGLISSTLVRRTWRTRGDGRVRESHRRAEGQTVGLGSAFVVGDALLRFPGDPLAPPSETAGCRCSVRWAIEGVRRRAAG